MLAVVLAMSIQVLMPELAAGSATPRSIAHFVSLATAGASGRFDEVYHVEGPSQGTIEIAQIVPERGFNAGSGKWSFLYLTKSGISSQWIQMGSKSWDCWHKAEVTTWTCSGPGRFHESNGFIQSVEPFLPGLVIGEVTDLNQASQAKPDPVKHIKFFGTESASFGPLRCVKVDATGFGLVTSCLDHRGVLVTQEGGSYWTKISLLKYGSRVPDGAFELKGVSTSSGQTFSGIPS
ncbi:MAG TPA: hypothetical protein VHV57_07520 [Acidimicrobiales bacterium]|jgi:hypothetical protein|nr:hypothetical protein [Acidimicrobiales bacterium]